MKLAGMRREVASLVVRARDNGGMTLHPNLTRVAGLIGTWRGNGFGTYPTITDFEYDDEWEIRDIGKPFLLFIERTKIKGVPMHTETGYLRFPSPDAVELVAAIPTGQSELAEGTVSEEEGALVIDMAGDVRNTSTAKQVDRIERTFILDGDDLAYEMSMAAVGQGMTLHLRSQLTRVADGSRS